MANIARASGVKVIFDLPTEEEKKSFNPMRNSSLESYKLLSLGWKGYFDAETGLKHTVEIIKELEQ